MHTLTPLTDKRYLQSAMYKCELCQINFNFQYQSIVHGYSHKKSIETKVTCELCDEKCVSLDHLKNHINRHVQMQKFKCGNCSKQFVSEYCYLKHREHHHHLNYVCALCDKTLNSKRGLTAHIRLHTRETPHKCGVCDKMFVRKDKLTGHVKRHNGKSERKPMCERVQATKIVFKCNECPKEYKNKRSLAMHTRSHTGDSSNVCEYCGQNFLRVDHLQRHKRIHKFNFTTKQCFCSVCGERFLKHQLKIHMIEHHSRKMLYECIQCNKSFSQKGNLIFHKRIHQSAIRV